MSDASATPQAHHVHYQGNLMPLNTTPTCDYGYLVVYDWGPPDRRVCSGWALIYSIAAQVPGSGWTNIENGAVD
jgi:hypothetical protein